MAHAALTARALLQSPPEAVWAYPDQLYDVSYEDGKVVTSRHKSLIFNRYCWELLTLYPQTPITTRCDVVTLLGDGFFNADTHIQLLQAIFGHICDHNHLIAYYQKEPLLRKVYETVNRIYNEIVQGVSPYVSTTDAVDYVQLVNDPKMQEIHAAVSHTPESIDAAYKAIKTYITTAETDNRFVKAYRAKAINENQANQCIGPRGFVTDLDRTVFRQPIMNGFIRGMGSLYELITESRTAAKSLNATDTHIRTSEYASRRIQLLTMSVVGVDPVDCGSTEYTNLFITEKMLRNMAGKYYVDPATGQLSCLAGNEKHLVDTVLQVRTALGCQCHDPAKICLTCLGKIAGNFRETSNLGYITTAALMEKLTQTILSTKHLTHSVKKALIQLQGNAVRYFNADDTNHIYFNPDYDLTGVYLILPNNRMGKLVDVLNLPHTNISLTKVGELDSVGLRDTKPKTPIQEVVDISYQDRLSIITKPFLDYIKSIRLESDSRGNFVIPMDGFNKKFPVFSNPLKETNIISFVNKIASMIETNRDKVSDPQEKLITLFSTVIEQFDCNLSLIEVMVYATTTFNAAEGNFRLGRGSVAPRCENKSALFRSRSISQLLVYEDQSKELVANAPVIFSNFCRSPHPMDVLFTPGALVR